VVNLPSTREEKRQVFDEIRDACAWVADNADWVRIRGDRLAAYAAQLPLEKIVLAEMDWEHHYKGDTGATVAYFLTLAAVNFGSGYFPKLAKRSGMSGYYTIASHLRDRFTEDGPLTAKALRRMDPATCTRIFHQSLENPPVQELMEHFSRALRQLGRLLSADFGGRFLNMTAAAKGAAGRLVEILKRMPYFDDRQSYKARKIPFYKRAQLAAADLSLAFCGEGPGAFDDLSRLTIFADNLVPHVLRMDGILTYRPKLLERIEAGFLIPAGSPEEVEMRACAVHAVELLRATPTAREYGVTAQQMDFLLWHHGQGQHYKAVPRHRTRTIFY
jgi:hypothetical protein